MAAKHFTFLIMSYRIVQFGSNNPFTSARLFRPRGPKTKGGSTQKLRGDPIECNFSNALLIEGQPTTSAMLPPSVKAYKDGA
jgi:hypothetical protein